MKRRAIALLQKIVGTDRFKEKCNAIGYSWEGDHAEFRLLDDGEVVAVGSENEIGLLGNVSAQASQREINDRQWDAFVALDRWRVAVHEAGHAIAALQLDLELEHVSLAEHTNSGETCLRGFAEAMSLDHPRRDPDSMMKFFAAGAAAELLIFNAYNLYGIEDDQSEFAAQAESQQAAAFDDFVRSVSKDLSPAQVLNLAKVLQERGFLSVHRAKLLIKESEV